MTSVYYCVFMHQRNHITRSVSAIFITCPCVHTGYSVGFFERYVYLRIHRCRQQLQQQVRHSIKKVSQIKLLDRLCYSLPTQVWLLVNSKTQLISYESRCSKTKVGESSRLLLSQSAKNTVDT